MKEELTRENYTYDEVKSFLSEAWGARQEHIRMMIDEIENIGMQLQTFQQRGKVNEYSSIMIPSAFWESFKSKYYPTIG